MTNKHSRLNILEKIAATIKVKSKAEKLRKEREAIEVDLSGLTTEEIIRMYRAGTDESPTPPELASLSTQQIIEKYQQSCRES